MFTHRKTAKDRCPESYNTRSFDPTKPQHQMSIYERWMLAQLYINKGEQPPTASMNGIVLRNVRRKRAPTTWHTIQHKIDNDTNVHIHNENIEAGDFTDDEDEEHDQSFLDSPFFAPSPASDINALKHLPDSQFASYLQAFSYGNESGNFSSSIYDNNSPMSDTRDYPLKILTTKSNSSPSMSSDVSYISNIKPRRVPKTLSVGTTSNTDISHRFKYQANIYRHISQNSNSLNSNGSTNTVSNGSKNKKRNRSKKIYSMNSTDDEPSDEYMVERTHSSSANHPIIPPKKLNKVQSEKYDVRREIPGNILLPLSLSVSTTVDSNNITPFIGEEDADEIVLIPVTRPRNKGVKIEPPSFPTQIPFRKNKGGRYFATRREIKCGSAEVEGVVRKTSIIREDEEYHQKNGYHYRQENGDHYTIKLRSVKHKHTMSNDDIESLKNRRRRRKKKRKHSVRSLWFKSQAQLKEGKQPSVLAVFSVRLKNIRQHTARYQVVRSRISHYEITYDYLQVMNNLTHSRQKIDIDDDEFSDTELSGSFGQSTVPIAPSFLD